MKIFMEYPLDENNDFYDGKQHEIEPIGLMSAVINSRRIYLLVYRDLTLGNDNMITLLERNGDRFQKIPLTDYESREFVNIVNYITDNGKRENISELQNGISTRKKPIPANEVYKPPKNEDIINPVNVEKPIKPNISQGNPPLIPIFYNEADGNYYWDQQCTKPIAGGAASLGTIDGNIIHGFDGKDYIIIPVYVRVDGRTPSSSDRNERKEPDSSQYFEQNNRKIPIYYNEANGRYYWDRSCTRQIIGAPQSLGNRSGNIIHGIYDYEIRHVFVDLNKNEKTKKIYYDGLNYYWDYNQSVRVVGAPKSLGTLAPEENVIYGNDGVTYTIINLENNKDNHPNGGRLRK